MNPVTTEGTPSSITAPAAAAAGPPSPAKTFPVVASRANPPERRRVINIAKYFRILNLVNNCHTASPPTTGKLTEKKKKLIFHSNLLVAGITLSTEEKHSVYYYEIKGQTNSPPGQLFLQVANTGLVPYPLACQHS